MMRLFVAIATIGRGEVVARTVGRLGRQTRRPDGVVVVGVADSDVAELAGSALDAEVVLANKGLCIQRNSALDRIGDRADIVLFLDDDFVAADTYLEQLEALFAARPDVVGATGRIIADGILHHGYSFDEAIALVEEDIPPAAPALDPAQALYGCNMAVRLAACRGLRFDEALPLYGWLEDIDFTYRLGQRGALVRSDRFAGVHMGAKAGRTSGLRLGYSQIANPVYMLRKRSAPPKLAFTMMYRNLLSNIARSAWPEPYVDRLGRLRGNLIAIAHLLTGRLDPRRIVDLG